MVDYVLAVEFDNKFGTYIRSTYPPEFDHCCDSILADYMIPDGTHRITEDYLIFRSVIPIAKSLFQKKVSTLNQQNPLVKLYSYKNDTRSYYDDITTPHPTTYPFSLTILNLKFLKFSYTKDDQLKEKYIIIHDNFNFKRLDQNLFTFLSEDDSV